MIYLLGVLRLFQHCTGHITTDIWKGRGNQYIQLVKDLYCKLPMNGKQLPAYPLEAGPGTEPRPQRWEARALPLCHHDCLICDKQVAIKNHMFVQLCVSVKALDIFESPFTKYMFETVNSFHKTLKSQVMREKIILALNPKRIKKLP